MGKCHGLDYTWRWLREVDRGDMGVVSSSRQVKEIGEGVLETLAPY